MQIVIWCITGLLCLLFKFSNAQPPVLNPTTVIRPLQIGDHVPDIILNNLYNYSVAGTKLSAFREKLLLLDFWATYCATCVQKMDHLEQLVKQYPKQLQVLLVSTAGKADTRQRINALFERVKNNAGKKFQLPVVVNDTALSTLFPNKYLPHIVWINRDQQVIAITGAEAVTAENIDRVLQGNTPEFNLKEDHLDFKPAKGLFKNGNGGSGNNFLYRTIVTPNVIGIPSSSSMEKDTTGKVIRISHTNAGLLFLINQAYDSDLPFSHLDLSQAGIELDYRNKDDQWVVNNSYCYELVIPPTTYFAAKELMQNDLQRYFGLRAMVRQVLTDCYILTADTVTLKRFQATTGKQLNNLFESSGKLMRNSRMNTLSSYLDAVLPIPVVNETNCLFAVDLDLPDKNPTDLAALNKSLLAYGLQLEPAKRVQPILLITNQTLKN